MADILKLIEERKSTRVPFDPDRSVDRKSLAQIVEAARWAPTAHNMQNFEIVVVNDARVLKELGSVKSNISEDFLRENYQQLSFSREELLRKKVGVLGAVFPPSWRDPSKFEAMARRGVPAPLRQTINGSPALLVVVFDPRRRAPASEGDVLGMISLGCVMENMWLVAQSLGLGFQIMSVFAGQDVENRVKEILEIPPQMKIAFAVRLGHPVPGKANYLRVRRNARAVAHYNHYGVTRAASR
jgi:nitroreductase